MELNSLNWNGKMGVEKLKIVMEKKKSVILSVCRVSFVVCVTDLFAWTRETHKRVCEKCSFDLLN